VNRLRAGKTGVQIPVGARQNVQTGSEAHPGLIYLLTAIGLPPGGSNTVHIYTQTIHRTTEKKQYIEQHKKQYIEQHKNVTGTVRAVPRLGELYPGICLTNEEKDLLLNGYRGSSAGIKTAGK
jgi:hypothetical protein